MKQLFLKIKPTAVLLLLKDSQQSWYPSKLARSAGMSYVHTVNLLSSLRENGIVSSEKKGRQSIFRLTDKGAAIASVLDDFAKKCDAAEQDAKEKQAQQSKQEEKASQGGQTASQNEAPKG